MDPYTCSVCGLGVIITAGEAIRACPHEGTPILANASASMAGRGGIQVGNGEHQGSERRPA